jgi:hypothetical protein
MRPGSLLGGGVALPRPRRMSNGSIARQRTGPQIAGPLFHGAREARMIMRAPAVLPSVHARLALSHRLPWS